MTIKAGGELVYDYTRMLSGAVSSKHGFTNAELKWFDKTAAAGASRVFNDHTDGNLPFMDLPAKIGEARKILAYADAKAPLFENFVVLGIGGSALGAIMLQTALRPAFYNLLPNSKRGNRPRLFVEDNVDPDRIADLLDVLDARKTLFCVVTKSGGTAETMSAFLVARDLVARRVGAKKVREHFVAITDAAKGNLRKIADAESLDDFIVPDGVGGRFSVLTPVGLLPAAMAGIDILALLRGAARMKKRCLSATMTQNPALMAAALQYMACTYKEKTIQVMMPYSHSLRDVADWYRQLWAESLGKKMDLDGNTVHAGQTPIKALGATDQHSQVQLYNEGPNDKTFTFLRVNAFHNTLRIPPAYKNIDALAYLGNRTMEELINAECLATEMAVTLNQRPNSCVILPQVNEDSLGQLLFMFEMQTAFAGALFNVNAFDQPGVEQGKIATYALMGRPGFEKEAEYIARFNKRLKARTV